MNTIPLQLILPWTSKWKVNNHRYYFSTYLTITSLVPLPPPTFPLSYHQPIFKSLAPLPLSRPLKELIPSYWNNVCFSATFNYAQGLHHSVVNPGGFRVLYVVPEIKIGWPHVRQMPWLLCCCSGSLDEIVNCMPKTATLISQNKSYFFLLILFPGLWDHSLQAWETIWGAWDWI